MLRILLLILISSWLFATAGFSKASSAASRDLLLVQKPFIKSKTAEKLLPKEFLNNLLIYLTPDSVARSECYAALPGPVVKQRNQMMARLLH